MKYYKNSDAGGAYMKIIDTRTIVHEIYFEKKYLSGVWIDVFPIDGCFDKKAKFMYEYKRIARYQQLVKLKMAQCGIGVNIKSKIFKSIILPIIKLLVIRMDIIILSEKIDNLARKLKIEEAPAVANMLGPYGYKEMMPKSFLQMIDVEFEGKKYKATKEWDLYLKSVYGNYMELPPENKRFAHTILAFKKE